MEDHRIIQLGLSPKQLSKMRKGQKVRINPQMEGKGLCLIVNPANYSLITGTFSRNKGLELSLSPEELEVNKSVSPQMEGKGIFGKSFDRGVEKLLGKKAKKAIYSEAQKLLPLAQAGLTAGLASGATALGAVQPELIPFLPSATAGLAVLGSDYLANPSKYQSNAGGSKANLAKDMASRYIQNKALESVNSQLGTNMDYLTSASLADAMANKAREQRTAETISNQYINPPLPSYQYKPPTGRGLYSGQGLYAGRGLYLSKSGGAVGLSGGFLNQQHQALQSQPYTANFQFQHTLSPIHRKIHMGAVGGEGLYVS